MDQITSSAAPPVTCTWTPRLVHREAADDAGAQGVDGAASDQPDDALRDSVCFSSGENASDTIPAGFVLIESEANDGEMIPHCCVNISSSIFGDVPTRLQLHELTVVSSALGVEIKTDTQYIGSFRADGVSSRVEHGMHVIRIPPDCCSSNSFSMLQLKFFSLTGVRKNRMALGAISARVSEATSTSSTPMGGGGGGGMSSALASTMMALLSGAREGKPLPSFEPPPINNSIQRETVNIHADTSPRISTNSIQSTENMSKQEDRNIRSTVAQSCQTCVSEQILNSAIQQLEKRLTNVLDERIAALTAHIDGRLGFVVHIPDVD